MSFILQWVSWYLETLFDYIEIAHFYWQGLPRWLSSKESACNAGDRRCVFNLWVEKISSRRKWQPTLVFSPGKSHGQRSLAGYSLLYCKESEMTEWRSMQCNRQWHPNNGKSNQCQYSPCLGLLLQIFLGILIV